MKRRWPIERDHRPDYPVVTVRNSLLVSVHLVERFEVVLDHRLELRRQIAGDVLNDLRALRRRHGAPVLGVLPQILLVDSALAAAKQDGTIRGGLGGLSGAAVRRTVARLLATAGAVAGVALTLTRLVLLLKFLDQFIEAEDDLLLDVLRLLATARKVQPTTAVVHQLLD